jgi:uncharacterized protein (TIGR03435 family)
MKGIDDVFGSFRGPLLTAARLVAVAALHIFGMAYATESWAQSQMQSAALSPAQDCAENAIPQPVSARESKGDGFRYTSVCVRPHKPDPEYVKHQSPVGETSDGFSERNTDLLRIIQIAYGIGVGRVIGAPDWLSGDNGYDFEAKMDVATADALKKLSPNDRKLARQHMLQTLLEDQLRLSVHTETREIPAYNLLRAKGGPKIQNEAQDPPKDTDDKCGNMESGANVIIFCGPGRIEWLRKELECFMAHPVIDKTDLKGLYTFSMHFRSTPEEWVKTHPEEQKDALPHAIVDQLGLLLEPVTISTKVIVIDHVERPLPN